MNTKVLNFDNRSLSNSETKAQLLDKVAKRALLNRFSELRDGQIILLDGDMQYTFGNVTQRCPLTATIHVNHPFFYSDIAFGGTIGAGEAYITNHWDTDDLTALVRILLSNRKIMDDMEGGFASLKAPIQKLLHWLNRNTTKGSRRNIAAHYDLGNDLFKLMLDDTMMYSCAIFDSPEMSLYDAQVHRLETVCQKLDLHENDHLLEIGTGWGGMSIYAAKNYGCQVTTTTISQQQYDLANERIKIEGLEDKITVLLDDYRDLDGKFDKLVSIEMIEAVGHQYYTTYFNKCSQLLKDDGVMLLQTITIADQQYETAKNSVDFIQKYIFPGGCLPSNTAILTAVNSASDLRLFDLADIGPHYATTLQKWFDNISMNKQKLNELGYNDEFLRMWEFYLSYCEGGFIERAISTIHMLLVKPDNRSVHLG